ncbi:multi-sensor signal transduction histidine kinase [Natrialba hulunbeirensis JCM 10989]|uniref:histidine kinase n=1 Tax=Natrialba hulunbeirensis JCM 10989 TaxID=1227493 RepID=M0A0D8_9EURY|nr:PAS domain-containing protein [Natrialba hulunbeirensis]ELY91796.1 multi-sensor signal transduction histidine kinase [Natrialba hulunbeirensis JCM 10989]
MTSIPSALHDLAETATVLQVGAGRPLTSYPTVHTVADVFLTVQRESNPSDALARLETTSVDCVVTNHNPPTLDALELLTTIRDDHPALPVILFPDDGSEALASEAIAADVTGYVPQSSATAGHQLVEQIAEATTAYEHRQLRHQLDQNPAVLLERISDGIIVLDETWAVTYANDGAQEFFQRPSSELIGQRLQDLVPEVVETTFYDHYRDVMANGGSKRIEEYYEPLDRWYAEYIYPTGNGLTIIFENITAKKERQLELEETTAQLHGLLDSIEAAIWIRDTDSQFVLLNQEYRTRYGIDPTEPIAGKPPEALFPDDVAAEIRVHDQHVLEQGSSQTFEEKRLTSAGYRTYLTRITPLFDDDGTLYATCGVSSEITEQKRTEQHLDVLNRILRHNLRNDMQIIHGYATELVASLEEPERAVAEQIQQQSTELTDLAHDAGAVNRLLSQPLDMQSISLQSVLTAVVTDLRATYPEAILRLDVPPSATVAADRQLLTLVCKHALENGIEHTETDPPEVHVTTAPTEGARLELLITDNGPGIPTRDRTAVLEETISTTTHSSGLGLWIMKWGITRLGGTLTIDHCGEQEQEQEQGTRVSLELRTDIDSD